MLRSLRWRLTGWYVLLLAGVLLLLSAGTYLAVHKLLVDNLDEVLRRQADLIAAAIEISPSGPLLGGSAPPSRNSEHFTRLYHQDGTLSFDDNAAIGYSPKLSGEVRDALGGDKETAQVQTLKGAMRVATFPIRRDGQIVGALQVGVTLEDVEDTMRALLKALLILVPAMLLLASGGGVFLAGRALSPIDRISRTAQRIGAENLSGRIGATGPDDEVGRLARTFDAMLARLEAAFASQRQFTADASHELRTPLTAIIGQIDVALERPRSPESYRATLAGVREQAQRLARLAGDLLLLARTDAPPTGANREPLDLATLLPAIVAQVEPLIIDRGQVFALAPLPPLVVSGNEDQLIRLVLNLLDNAIRYTPAGGRITVCGARDEAWIDLSISDNGPGIAPEHLPRLFDRFFRADRVRSRAQGGSGLGLSIAQGIAQAHGGRIDVESAVGRGSTFTVRLPSAGWSNGRSPGRRRRRIRATVNSAQGGLDDTLVRT
jgi:heavy metal sensor kinase